MDDGLSMVVRLNRILALLVGLGVLLSLADHTLNILVIKAARRLDDNVLLLAGALVLCADVHDTVGINIKDDLNLGDAAGCRGNSHEGKLAKSLVIRSHLTLALADLDLHLRLPVLGSREDLALLGGDGCVAGNEAGKHSAHRLNAKREGSHIEQKHILDVSGHDTTLDGGAHSDGLIWVDGLRGLPSKQILHSLLHLGHARHAADKNDLLNVRPLQSRVLEALLARLDRPRNQGRGQLLITVAGELRVEMLGSRGIRGEVGKVDLGLHRRRQLNLGLLGGVAQALEGEGVLAHVNVRLLLEVVLELLEEEVVKVLASEEGVAVRRLHLKHTLLDLKDGNVKGTTAEIVHCNHAVLSLVEAVREGSGSGLVDNAEDVEACNLPGVLGGLALRVVKVRRDGDDGVLGGLAKISLGGLLHLHEHKRTNLAGRIRLVADLDPRIAVGSLDNLI
eukprot:Opistho-2@41109